MSSTEIGTNLSTQLAVEAALPELARAMESWVKNRTIPEDYLRKQLGNQAQVVIVQPVQSTPKPASSEGTA
jgi:hypothetical protein